VVSPITVAEFRSTHTTAGGPDKTILFSAAAHDSTRVRVVPFFLVPRGDAAPGLRDLARASGVEPVLIPDRGPGDLSLIVRMERELRERGCRVLHAHDFKTDVLGIWLARRSRRMGLLATAHGWSNLLTRRQRLYHAADEWALRRYPLVVAVSEATATRLRGIGVRDDRIAVVPNGIDIERWRPRPAPDPRPRGLPAGRRFIGTVGRLSIDKDTETLLDAFAAIAPAHTDLDLLVVGEGPERPELERRAVARGLGTRVRFLGHRADSADLYAAMEVFVLSSRTEGMPNTLLEAMAMGRPCVVTPVGGVAEVVRDGVEALFVPPGDAGGMGAVLGRVLGDGRLRESLGRAARARVEEAFSFARRVRRMEEIYERLARV
jgi:glycosyltransferase involved in cell wall biosynthesis